MKALSYKPPSYRNVAGGMAGTTRRKAAGRWRVSLSRAPRAGAWEGADTKVQAEREVSGWLFWLLSVCFGWLAGLNEDVLPRW